MKMQFEDWLPYRPEPRPMIMYVQVNYFGEDCVVVVAIHGFRSVFISLHSVLLTLSFLSMLMVALKSATPPPHPPFFFLFIYTYNM